MSLFEISAILMVLPVLFTYVNYRVFHMPTTIGVMFIALAVSLGIVLLGWFGVDVGQVHFASLLETIDFNQALLSERIAIIAITCIIVVFSIVTQGMTLGRLVKNIYPDIPGEKESENGIVTQKN